MSAEDLAQLRQIKVWLGHGHSVADAAVAIGISYQRANTLVARGKLSLAEMKERRKAYIVSEIGPKKVGRKPTPNMLASFFAVDETHVKQLIKELQTEGRLPPPPEGGLEWQEEVLKTLRRRYPNVFRSSTVRKVHEVGDKVYVAGKGWLTWDECKELVSKLQKR